MSLSRQSLSKSERLKSYKRIRELFAEGKKLKVQSLLVYYRFQNPSEMEKGISNLQMGVSVGARYFKRAVDRNLMKRRIREAYRKNNAVLKQASVLQHVGIDVFFVYANAELLPYEQLETQMINALQLLMEKINKRVSSKPA